MKYLHGLYGELTSEPTFRLTADRLVRLCGIRPDLNGYALLTDAVILVGAGAASSAAAAYEMIAGLRGITKRSVIRDISYALNHTLGMSSRLLKLLGVRIKDCDLSPGLAVALLAKLFADPVPELYM